MLINQRKFPIIKTVKFDYFPIIVLLKRNLESKNGHGRIRLVSLLALNLASS